MNYPQTSSNRFIYKYIRTVEGRYVTNNPSNLEDLEHTPRGQGVAEAQQSAYQFYKDDANHMIEMLNDNADEWSTKYEVV